MSGENAQMTFDDVVTTLVDEPKDSVRIKDGTLVKVHKVKMRHISAMLSIANRIISELGVTQDGAITVDLHSTEALLKLISKLPAEVAQCVLMLSDLSEDKYSELDLADGLDVVKKVISVNHAFFMEEVKPRFGSLLASLEQSPSQ